VSGPEKWWTRDEVAFLEEHYPERGPAIGLENGRGERATRIKANRMGILMKPKPISEAHYRKKLRKAGIYDSSLPRHTHITTLQTQ
jgi:hypothetical protein